MAATEYGKFLKKLRIDKDEQLQKMALNVGVSSSYLSSIESGTREIPVDFTAKIADSYNLPEEDRNELKKLELSVDRKALQIDFEKNNCSTSQKEVALLLAEKLPHLSDSQINAIKTILNSKEASL